jgi:hypothetical protein
VVALAGIAARSMGSAAHVAAITGLVALAHLGACMLGAFLRHLLDRVGHESPASHAFTVAQLLLGLATASLVPLAIVEAQDRLEIRHQLRERAAAGANLVVRWGAHPDAFEKARSQDPIDSALRTATDAGSDNRVKADERFGAS